MSSVATINKDQTLAVVIMAVIFVLETIVSFHTLWPEFPALVFLAALSMPLSDLINGNTSGRWVKYAFGLVIGEFGGYFWAVPPTLTLSCFGSPNLYNVQATVFLRIFSITLFYYLSRELNLLSISGSLWETTKNSQGKLTKIFIMSLPLLPEVGLMLLFAAMQSTPTRIGNEAQILAKQQLGADYADYNLFVREIRQNFLNHTVTAQLIAYPPVLFNHGATRDVTVSWEISQN